MKLYGYEDAGALKELQEVSIVATASELRSLADMLVLAAKKIEGLAEDTSDHIHFSDFFKGMDSDSADIVVMTVAS
ncbi:hypothetical protein VV867_30830 [Pseudomonas sp. JH-2]|uniref:Imm32 family immunity protein n=1 Tax=unclassified Pseudomonas TaxID=196821 RepID=UPI000D6F8B06|nr:MULTISPECIES: hypothetical protein [unclassified Pseudomonas]MED5612118.1 hypothetical protein [Pseudomonas sp. JH-2]PWU27794.1 hypothetical protein DK254_18060 [Pseudomonas sp. RW407]